MNTNIAMQDTSPQFESPVNALAKVLQIRDAQQGQQLHAMKMDEYSKGVERQNGLRQLLTGFGNDHQANQQKLMQGGYLKEAQDYGKNQADLAKTNSEVQFKQIETAHKKIDLMGQVFGFVKDNPSAESAIQATDYLVQNGIMTAEQAQATKAKIAADPSPETIRTLATQAYQSALSTKDQLPTLSGFSTGGSYVQTARNPITGASTETGRTAMTATPGELLRSEDAAKVRAQTERHFQAGQSAPQYMETDQGLVALPKRLANGQVPTGTLVNGADGQPLGKPLKPIPASVNTAIIQNSQSVSQIDRALNLLSGNNQDGMQGDKNATGWKGYLPNGILNRVDPQGVDARALVSDIGSLKIHDRSGAAVTISESPRLMPFIPLSTDDAATVQKKLKKLRVELAGESQAMQDVYSKDQGYRPSPVKARPAAGDIHSQADAILNGGK